MAKRPASSTKKAKTRDAAAPEEPAEPDETEEPVEEGDKKNKEDKSEKKADKSEKKEKEKKEKDKEKKEKDAEKAAAKAKAEKYEKMREEQKKAKAAAKAKAKGKAKLTHTQRDEERAQALKIDSDKEAEEEKEEKGEGEEKVEELRDPKKAWYFNKVQAQLPQEIRALWESKGISRADKSKLANATVEKKGGHYALVLDNPVISALTETYQSVVGKECLVDFLCLLQFGFLELFISENSSDLICDVFPTCFLYFSISTVSHYTGKMSECPKLQCWQSWATLMLL